MATKRRQQTHAQAAHMAHPLKRNRGHIAPPYNLGVVDHYNLNPAAVGERGYERTSLLCAETRVIPQIPPLSSNSIDTSRDSVGILRSTGTRCNHRRGRKCSRSQRTASATRCPKTCSMGQE